MKKETLQIFLYSLLNIPLCACVRACVYVTNTSLLNIFLCVRVCIY